jgi:hypothetical protein
MVYLARFDLAKTIGKGRKKTEGGSHERKMNTF